MAYFRAGTARATHEAQQITVAKTPLATFESNVSGLYIPEILAYFSATQSGTGDPSPSNPRAISGVSEVTTACNAINQWDEQWEGGSISQADGTNTPASNQMRAKNYIVVLPNANYYIKSPNITGLRFYDANKTFVRYLNNKQNSVVTIPNGIHFMRFVCVATTYNNDISINYPSTDTTYHAYTGTTATTALGGTYYGGYVNLQTGLLTVTDGIVDLGSLTWTYRSGNKLFTAYKSNIKLSNNTKGTPCLCDTYKETYGGSWSGWANFPNEHISSGNNYSSGDVNIAVKDLRYTDKDTFKTAMNGVQLVYELATPQTVQLTPAQIEQLLGQNNVFASTGDVAVKYWRID